eukprot:4810255-Amphidinium_carterae.4
MTIKTPSKGIIGYYAPMWSFHMGSLSVVRDRHSQAVSNNLFSNWWRESHPGPSFRTFSEPWSDQNPEVPDSFGHCLPSK